MSIMLMKTAAFHWLFTMTGLMSVATAVPAVGQSTKEYIRLGGRVIAIENSSTSTGQPGFSPGTGAFFAEGGSNTVTLTSSGNWTMTSSNGLQFAVVPTGTSSCSGVTMSTSANGPTTLTTICYSVPPSAPTSLPTLGGLVAPVPTLTATVGGTQYLFTVNQQHASISVFDANNLNNILSAANSQANAVLDNVGAGWTAAATSSSNWVQAAKSGGQLVVTAAQNSGAARSGIVRISSASGVAMLTIPVTQLAAGQSQCTISFGVTGTVPAAGGPFSSTVNLSSAGQVWSPTIPSGSAWLSITGTTTGTSTGLPVGTVNYSATPNPGSARSATIAVTSCNQSWPVSISQSAASKLSIAPAISYSYTTSTKINYLAFVDGTILSDQSQVSWGGSGQNFNPSQLSYTSCDSPSKACYTTAPPFANDITITANWAALPTATAVIHPSANAPNSAITLLQMENPLGVVSNSGRSGTLHLRLMGTQTGYKAPYMYLAVGPTVNNPDYGCYFALPNNQSAPDTSGPFYLQDSTFQNLAANPGFFAQNTTLSNSQCVVSPRLAGQNPASATISTTYVNGQQSSVQVQWDVYFPIQFNYGMANAPLFFGASADPFYSASGWTNVANAG